MSERSAESLADTIAQQLVPADAYAAQPLPQAFSNLENMAPLLRASVATTFDVTAFYSRPRSDLAPEATEELTAVNAAAYAAARRMGGLLLYYQGEVLADEPTTNNVPELGFTPICLSFCVWESRRQARVGSSDPAHRRAEEGTPRWYEAFGIKKYSLRLEPAGLQFQED